MRFDDIKESAFMAIDTLRANKLRSALTILGVSVGVVTVIFMVSIIQGLNKAFADQIESLGSNTIFVSKFEPSFGRPPGPEEIHRKDLTMDDAEALRTEAPSIVGVSPIHRMIASTIRYQDKQTDTPILFGVTPYYEFVHTQYVACGRFINDIDMQDRSNVVIIGVDVKQALFPYEDPVDKEVRINGNPLSRDRRDGAVGKFLRTVARQLDLHSAYDVRQVLSRSAVSGSRFLRHRAAAFARLREICDRRDHRHPAAHGVAFRRARPTTSASLRRIRCWTFTTS